MCSIGGFVADKPLPAYQVRDLCKALLWYGQERGAQSSGLYVNGRVAKRAQSPREFIESEDFYAVTKHEARMALTHTRMPTSGGTGDAQAQPFQVAQTVSVHNGMLFDCPALKQQWQLAKESGVDSELVARFVDRYGVKRLPEFIASSYGPSAIAVIHQGALFLIRDNNPTVACTMRFVDGNSITVFGSEYHQVMQAMARVWLVPPGYHAKSVKESVLVRVNGGGLEVISKPLKRKYKSYIDDAWYGNGCTDGNRVWASVDEWERERKESQSQYQSNGKTWKERKRDRRLRKMMEKGGQLYLGEDTRKALPPAKPEGEI